MKAALPRSGFLFLFVLLCCAFGGSGDERLVIKVRHDYFTCDNIGNLYAVKEDELVKYLPSGKFFARYSNLRLGAITTVDATNPLKLLLYYRDFQQIVFLDNQLSQNSEVVSLEKLGYEQASLVCASANNSFWIYSRQNNELVRFDQNARKISATGNLKQVLQTEINPDFMVEHNNLLYLNSAGTGIYVFDIFGAFSKVISVKTSPPFRVSDAIIYYQKDSALCSYDHRLFDEACKPLPLTGASARAIYGSGKLYIGNKDSIVIRPF